jgi:hypothetical protein
MEALQNSRRAATRVHDHQPGAAEAHKFNDRESDRAGADDQDGFAGAGRAAVHRVAADGQGFHQRQLVGGQAFGGVQLAGGEEEPGAQAAVGVHPEHLEVFAAVGPAAAAGRAGLAVDVGLDRTAVPGGHVGDVLGHGEHLHAEFMSGNARVGEERHLSQPTGVIGAADAHPLDADQGFAGAGWRGFREVEEAELLGFFELDRAHGAVWGRGGERATSPDISYSNTVSAATLGSGAHVRALEDRAIPGFYGWKWGGWTGMEGQGFDGKPVHGVPISICRRGPFKPAFPGLFECPRSAVMMAMRNAG